MSLVCVCAVELQMNLVTAQLHVNSSQTQYWKQLWMKWWFTYFNGLKVYLN